ncbi:MAG: hypothetical protein K6G36_00460 [Candidatus Saccharibacteria bacterium]|nr:hypothetical protein [Candidatus Saccharibacteria bacterium]
MEKISGLLVIKQNRSFRICFNNDTTNHLPANQPVDTIQQFRIGRIKIHHTSENPEVNWPGVLKDAIDTILQFTVFISPKVIQELPKTLRILKCYPHHATSIVSKAKKLIAPKRVFVLNVLPKKRIMRAINQNLFSETINLASG